MPPTATPGPAVDVEVVEIMVNDARFAPTCMFAMTEASAEAARSQLSAFDNGRFVAANLQVLHGSEGLQKVLASQIAGWVVHGSHRLIASMLRKLWAAGKHVIARGPLAPDADSAYQLLNEYSTIYPSTEVKPSSLLMIVSIVCAMKLQSLSTV